MSQPEHHFGVVELDEEDSPTMSTTGANALPSGQPLAAEEESVEAAEVVGTSAARMPTETRRGDGRKPTAEKLIADNRKRSRCFNKRKKGVYKKVKELATLTGAQVVFAVASSSGRTFSFTTTGLEDFFTDSAVKARLLAGFQRNFKSRSDNEKEGDEARQGQCIDESLESLEDADGDGEGDENEEGVATGDEDN